MAVGLCVFFSLFSDFFSFRFSLSFEEGCGGSEGGGGGGGGMSENCEERERTMEGY